MDIVFRKTGTEIKAAVAKRREQLGERLDRRNAALSTFMQDGTKVRSYLIRGNERIYGHGQTGYVLAGAGDISSEEREEVDQLCLRIFEIEQELYRLSYISTHLDDDTVFDLSLSDLLGYGFEATN